MLAPDLVDADFEEFLKSLNYSRDKKPKQTITIKRITELSTPKKKLKEDYYELLGPGRYNPLDNFLSTKCKSPSVKIGKSQRFNQTPLSRIAKSTTFLAKQILSKSAIFTENSAIPGYTFKRTGHNLRLVDNPGFPGVGRYSPGAVWKNNAYSFRKSKREFDWQRNAGEIENLAKFDRKYIDKT